MGPQLQFLLVSSLLLVTLFGSKSACSRKHRPRYHRRTHHHHPHYQTTTERYKRSIDDNQIENPEYRFLECGEIFCPNSKYYPTAAIIEAVDRLHQHLHADKSHRQEFADKGMHHDQFFTSKRSQTLDRRPTDHWYYSNPVGCKVHAKVTFPKEGYSSDDRETYYVVNVPNLRQGVIQYSCMKTDQTCSKDETAGAVTKTCQQNYKRTELVVLPAAKNRFDVRDFKVATFYVLDSCVCAPAGDADSEVRSSKLWSFV